ncbi:MAG: WhiB family transcriptional regulator [Acidimicrobiales bacterium]
MFAPGWEEEPAQGGPALGGPAPGAGADPWAGAACRTEGPALTELFFSDQIPDIARAKAICGTCPLAEPCLAGALARREAWGVWGGQLFVNGKMLAHKRKRGRPRKVRPEEAANAAGSTDMDMSA